MSTHHDNDITPGAFATKGPGTFEDQARSGIDDALDAEFEWTPGASDDGFDDDFASDDSSESAADAATDDDEEVASPETESTGAFESLTDEELDRLDDEEPPPSELPEFSIEPVGAEAAPYDEEDELEYLPEIGGAGGAEIGPLLGAVASAAAPLVAKAGKRAIKKALGKLSKKAKRRYRGNSKLIRHLHPAAGLFIDAVRQCEMSTDFGGAESGFDDPAVVDEIAQAMEIVLGTDDRTRVQATTREPWKKICALRIHTKDGRQARGTGFLVGPRTVLTAGHCVFAHDLGGWMDRVDVIPAANGSASPFGSWTSRSFRSVKGWTKRRSAPHDYGCITLPEGADTEPLGHFGIKQAPSRRALLGKCVTVAGYPGDKPFAQLWKGNDRVKSVSRRKLVYRSDTTPGMSGSPVFVTEGRRRYVVGIHNYGNSGGNSATRINARVARNVGRWIRAGRESAVGAS